MLVILIHCNRSVKKHESSIIMEQSLNFIIFKKEKRKKSKGMSLSSNYWPWCSSRWFILSMRKKEKRERKWRVGTGDKALIFWSRMQMWGLVTFTRDMVLAFYVRNFQETSNLMDVWTYGWGDLEMILS